MNEQQFNKKVQDLWIKEGGYIIKTIVTNKAGAFDMFACMPNNKGIGRFCALEGKVGYNKASDLQLAHMNRVIASGGLAYIVTSLDQVRTLIEWARIDYIQPQYLKNVVKINL